MFPINFVEFYLRDFGKAVLELADERGAAVLAIKPMSLGAWPKTMKRTRKWWYRSVEEPPTKWTWPGDSRSRSRAWWPAFRRPSWTWSTRPLTP